MCFSASASLSSAALLLGARVLALRQKPTRQALPYACMPLLFGLQQLLEGLLWLKLQSPEVLPACVSANALAQAFSLFSQVVWPLFVPVAVGLLERVVWRRRAIMACTLAGLSASMFLLSAMLQIPTSAQVQGQHMVYHFSHTHVLAASSLYLLGACLAPLLSSHASVRAFGVAALATAALSYLVFSVWFISVWCFFAGLLSCIVLLHFFPQTQQRLRLAWRSHRAVALLPAVQPGNKRLP